MLKTRGITFVVLIMGLLLVQALVSGTAAAFYPVPFLESNLSQNNSNKVNLVVNGKSLQPDVTPQLIKGRTMVPIRFVAENLGIAVDFDSSSNTVIATKGDTVVELQIDGKAFKNQEEIPLDSAAMLMNGRVMVPVRFISEAFGANVTWNETTNTVTIMSEATNPSTEEEITVDVNTLKVTTEEKIHEVEKGLHIDDSNSTANPIYLGGKWEGIIYDDGDIDVFKLTIEKTEEELVICFGSIDRILDIKLQNTSSSIIQPMSCTEYAQEISFSKLIKGYKYENISPGTYYIVVQAVTPFKDGVVPRCYAFKTMTKDIKSTSSSPSTNENEKNKKSLYDQHREEDKKREKEMDEKKRRKENEDYWRKQKADLERAEERRRKIYSDSYSY